MALFEGKTPAERNKMIAAVVLPLLALIFVVRMLFGSSTPTRPANSNNARANTNRSTPRPNQQNPADLPKEVAEMPTEIDYEPVAFSAAGAGRNIFAYYVKPVAPAPIKTEPTLPPPTPTPPPPLALSSLSPASVYARTSGFTMQVSGDKFTPEARVFIDGQEVPTQFRGPQQLTATVAASSLAAPGARSVVVRTPDNTLFSNNATLNVMQPPAPTHTYVGMIARPRGGDTALLKNQKGELVGVQAGDIVEGRFRVAGINTNAVDLVDKDLNVRHTLPYVEVRSTGQPGRVPGSIQPPPPPKPDDGDDEP